jgi:hypothetical protein
MQWPSIMASCRFIHDAKQPGLWDSEPEQGSLPESLIPALVPVLARHTSTLERCWFEVYDGYGCLAIGDDEAPDFELPHRRILLMTGSIGRRAHVAVMMVQPTDGVTWASDRLNPLGPVPEA